MKGKGQSMWKELLTDRENQQYIPPVKRSYQYDLLTQDGRVALENDVREKALADTQRDNTDRMSRSVRNAKAKAIVRVHLDTIFAHLERDDVFFLCNDWDIYQSIYSYCYINEYCKRKI